MSGFELTVHAGSFKSTVKDTVDGYAQAPQSQWNQPRDRFRFKILRVERISGKCEECNQGPATRRYFMGSDIGKNFARPVSLDVNYGAVAFIDLCEVSAAQLVSGEYIFLPQDSRALRVLNGVVTVDSARTVEPQPQRGQKDPRVNGGM